MVQNGLMQVALKSQRPLRLIGLLLLAAITVVGAISFLRADWKPAVAYWANRWPLIFALMAVQGLSVTLDGILWIWMLRYFKIRPRGRTAGLIFLSGYAGLLLPLQLGKVVRADLIARLRLGTFKEAVAAEAVLLYLMLAAACAIVFGIVASRFSIVAAPISILIILLLASLIAQWGIAAMSRRSFMLPVTLRRRGLFGMAALSMAGWSIGGFILYVILRDQPGQIPLWQALAVAPANAVLGAGTGLPGGIGAFEAFLGISLRLLQVPPATLALAVAALRLVTFWMWIPVGWAALTLINREIANNQ